MAASFASYTKKGMARRQGEWEDREGENISVEDLACNLAATETYYYVRRSQARSCRAGASESLVPERLKAQLCYDYQAYCAQVEPLHVMWRRLVCAC